MSGRQESAHSDKQSVSHDDHEVIAETVSSANSNGAHGGNGHAAASRVQEHTQEHGQGTEHASGGTGASHGAPKPKAKKSAVLDLSDVITVGRIAAVLRGIANEPGESGEIVFEVKASGKVGSGVVNGVLEGVAELKIGYAIDNNNFSQLFVDAEGAIAAGIDLAGFAQATVEVGFGKDFLNQWFRGSESAATWILHQLERLNNVAGGRAFKFGKDAPQEHAAAGDGHGDGHGGGAGGGEHGGGHGGGPGVAAFEVHDTKAFVGAGVAADIGVVSAEAKYRRMELNRTYHDDQHNVFPSHETHHQTSVGFEVALGHTHLSAKYERDYNETTGSPIFYTNGVFCNNQISVGIAMHDLISKGGHHVNKIPPDKVQDFVLKVFSGLESLAVKFPHANALNSGLFDAIVKQMYEHAHVGNVIKMDAAFNVHFQWEDYGESNGDLKLMYFRVKVEPEITVEMGHESVAGGIEAGMKISKSEVIYEHIGSETVSYIQRQFIYQNPDRPWTAFKADNYDQVLALAVNMATPGFTYYTPEVEAAYHKGKGENGPAAIAAMEHHWTATDRRLAQVAPDAAKVGDAVGEATSFFTFFDSTKRAEMDKIFEVLDKYAEDPGALKFFFDQLPNYGVDLKEIYNLAKELKVLGRYTALRSKALSAGKA